MTKLILWRPIIIGMVLALAGLCQAQSEFTPSCDSPRYPMPAPATAPPVDAQCGLTGSGGREAQQNGAKNNFCPNGTTAKPVSIADLTQLQESVNQDNSIPFGDEANPPRKAGPAQNRRPLKQLGEGHLAVFTGYVLIARQEGKESVNCGARVANEPADHDIHISLVQSSDVKDECQGIVAEIAPHHRPDSWTALNVNAVAHSKAKVRVTGQLMFDSSHVPCANGQRVRSNPSRVSLWEIHPIYDFEVCTAKCETTHPTWSPLNAWVSSHHGR